MALVSKVGAFANTGGFWPPADRRKDQMMKVATTCHFATCYWLYEEAHGKPFTFDVFMDRIGNPTLFIAKLLPRAVLLQQSYRLQAAAGLKVKATDAAVQAGSVVVFAESKTSPGHSCVAITSTRVGGYNQTDWFASAGKEHEYTEHDTLDIVWKTKHRAQRFKTEYTLYAVPEATALQAMRDATG